MQIRFDGKTVVVSGTGMGSAGASPRPLLNWVPACSVAIYPPGNLRKPQGLESRQRWST